MVMWFAFYYRLSTDQIESFILYSSGLDFKREVSFVNVYALHLY